MKVLYVTVVMVIQLATIGATMLLATLATGSLVEDIANRLITVFAKMHKENHM